MAKRQNFIVGSTNAVSETLTDAELNTAWNRFEILGAGKLDGVFKAVSDYSNDSSNEIANAIQSLTGSQPSGSSQTELADALQQMRNEIETTSLTFKGYVATSAPSSSTYTLVEGNLWINSATMPTSFPIAASSIKEWNGSSWVNYGSTYTPKDFDFFRNINDNEGYYWFGGLWTVMSTDMSTTYFTLNQSTGKWEIKSSVNLPGSPTTTTPDAADQSTKIATTQFAHDFGQRYVTNCITEIPQDIKLELNNGTLTLKAGSKLYVPNGAGVFDEIIVQNDSQAQGYANLQGMVFISKAGITTFFTDLSQIQSGSSGTLGSGNIWYDTTTNKIFRSSDGSSWDIQVGFPICIVTSSNDAIASIDQVFNGFGYIGSTVFALPGVKGLIPNGRNADGSLKNIATINTVCRVYTLSSSESRTNIPILVQNNTGLFRGLSYRYDEINNYNYNYDNINSVYVAVYISYTNGVINSFAPKTAFHAVDYNDYNNLVNDVNTKDAQNVKLTGNQTISGTKTFNSSPIAPTPATTENDGKVATTKWVRDLFSGGFGGPDYSSMIAVTSPYTPTKNGYLIVQRTGTYGTVNVVNDTYTKTLGRISCTDSDSSTQVVMVVVNKGEQYSFSPSNATAVFVPAKGE